MFLSQEGRMTEDAILEMCLEKLSAEPCTQALCLIYDIDTNDPYKVVSPYVFHSRRKLTY
jgi:hypothetical protein